MMVRTLGEQEFCGGFQLAWEADWDTCVGAGVNLSMAAAAGRRIAPSEEVRQTFRPQLNHCAVFQAENVGPEWNRDGGHLGELRPATMGGHASPLSFRPTVTMPNL